MRVLVPLPDEAFWLDFDATKCREEEKEDEAEAEAEQKTTNAPRLGTTRFSGELTQQQEYWECCSCEEASHQAVVACCLRLLQWCGRQIVRWRWRDLLFDYFFFLLLFRFLVFYANAFWFLVCDSAVFNSDAVVFVLLLLFLYDRHTATETSVVCAWRTLRSVAPPAHFHFHLMLQIGTAYINNI